MTSPGSSRPVGQVVKTRPFHGCNMGSIPVRVIKKLLNLRIEELFYASRTRNRRNTGRPQAAKKSPVDSFLVFGSHESGMSTVVAAAFAHLRKGVFY